MPKKNEERKDEHLDICLRENVQAKHATTGFEEIFMIHKALPELNLNEIRTECKVFNHKFSAPLIVESMTGGTHNGGKINAAIAEAVEELGLGMGLGSQRTALEKPNTETTFSVARRQAPNAFIMANIGAAQLATGYGPREAKKAVKMLEADALLIHMNPLQEAVQPEGEANFKGVAAKIKAIVDSLDVPVIVKEVGCGIAASDAKRLEALGVAGIDVAGAGGTSWTAVEYFRAKKRRDESRQRIGETFWDWGIPTAASLIETAQVVHIPVIASGGLRSGIDMAKALVLGASLTGVAYPVLDAAFHGAEEVKKKLQLMQDELKATMFLVGAGSVQELLRTPLVVTGRMADWLIMRGIEPQNFARRDL